MCFPKRRSFVRYITKIQRSYISYLLLTPFYSFGVVTAKKKNNATWTMRNTKCPPKNIKHSSNALLISFETCAFSLYNLYILFVKLASFKWKRYICFYLTCHVIYIKLNEFTDVSRKNAKNFK